VTLSLFQNNFLLPAQRTACGIYFIIALSFRPEDIVSLLSNLRLWKVYLILLLF